MACKATVPIGDDFGDNEATITCDKPEGHDGAHSHSFNVFMEWQGYRGHRCRKWAAIRIYWDYHLDPPDPDYEETDRAKNS